MATTGMGVRGAWEAGTPASASASREGRGTSPSTYDAGAKAAADREGIVCGGNADTAGASTFSGAAWERAAALTSLASFPAPSTESPSTESAATVGWLGEAMVGPETT